MINIAYNPKIKLDKTPLKYCRVSGRGTQFYFRCSNGHLNKSDSPISTFKNFEGTSKNDISCNYKGCKFHDHLLLMGWAYRE
jgi:hypothetical protein